MSRYSEITASCVRPASAASQDALRRPVHRLRRWSRGIAVAIVLVGALAALFGDMVDGTPAYAGARVGAVGCGRCGDGDALGARRHPVRPRRPRAGRGHPAARGGKPGAPAHEGAHHQGAGHLHALGRDREPRRGGRRGDRRRRARHPRRRVLPRHRQDQAARLLLREPVGRRATRTTRPSRPSRRSSSPRTCATGWRSPRSTTCRPRSGTIIRQHHGTSLVRYFYNKAAALDAAVFEADFRYQGEKPTSREAALVMLADSSEAAVRALKQPTEPARRGRRAGHRRRQDRRRSARRRGSDRRRHRPDRRRSTRTCS